MTGDTTSLVPGFPIRTSSDPRSVDNSPRHIAASHVLHRPLMPRHPPCALTHLQHKKPKKKHNSTNKKHSCLLDARNHYPQIKHHTPPPSEATTHHNKVLPQDPTVCRQFCFPRRCSHPARAHYRRRTPHGSHPTNWGVFRGAP